jgi:hypothetical protein
MREFGFARGAKPAAVTAGQRSARTVLKEEERAWPRREAGSGGKTLDCGDAADAGSASFIRLSRTAHTVREGNLARSNTTANGEVHETSGIRREIGRNRILHGSQQRSTLR